MHLDTIKVYYSPTNAQLNVLKNNIKIYIKIAPTCFGVVTSSSGSSLSLLTKVTLVKMVNYGSSVYDYISGYGAAYIGSALVDVCMSHCSGVE